MIAIEEEFTRMHHVIKYLEKQHIEGEKPESGPKGTKAAAKSKKKPKGTDGSEADVYWKEERPRKLPGDNVREDEL